MQFNTFDAAKVTEITGMAYNGPGRDSLVYWDNATVDQLQKLIDAGIVDPNAYFNSAPQVKIFLQALTPVASKVKLIGYAVFPPRRDTRVTVEGFELTGATADEALQVVSAFRHADEQSIEKQANGLYNVRFWWD